MYLYCKTILTETETLSKAIILEHKCWQKRQSLQNLSDTAEVLSL